MDHSTLWGMLACLYCAQIGHNNTFCLSKYIFLNANSSFKNILMGLWHPPIKVVKGLYQYIQRSARLIFWSLIDIG